MTILREGSSVSHPTITINRKVESTPTVDVVAMATMLLSLPAPLECPDAIGVLTGLDERWRLIQAIDAWNTTSQVNHLVIAGSSTGESGWFHMDLNSLSETPYNLRRRQGVVIQTKAFNTREQADWMAEVINNKGIKNMSLFVSPYHILRGYCTVLAALRRTDNLQFPLFPVPVIIPPATLIPETGNTAWDSVAGEVKRILDYQKKGDVASYEEFMAYINWLWTHPLIADSEL